LASPTSASAVFAAQPTEFEEATIIVERNDTDGDINPVQDEVVGSDALTIQWSTVSGIAQYIVEIENESADPEQALTVNVPASFSSFDVPAALLVPGADYQVGIAAVGQNGNITLTETTFSTAE
jgi:hypothetical protein